MEGEPGVPGRIAPCALCLDTCVYRAPCAVTGGRNAAMFTRLFSTIVGAGIGFAVTAVPAYAADDIEAKVQMCAACHGQNGVPDRPENHSDHLGSAAELSGQAIARLQKWRARQPDHVAHSQSPCAGGSSQDRSLFRGQELAGATGGRRRRRRRPTESPSASPAISRILRAARRRRGWRGSATNTWSQRCATSPPMKGPTTATCRNSCKR